MPDPNTAAGADKARRRRLPSGYLGVADLAAEADAALSTIYDNIAKGRITAAKWRGIIVVSESSAKEFMAVRPIVGADTETCHE